MSRADAVPSRSSAFLLAIPAFAAQFRPVPEPYFEHSTEKAVMVRCPCGTVPTVGFAQLEECPCGRVYFLGRRLMVAGGPKSGWAEGDPALCECELCGEEWRSSEDARALSDGFVVPCVACSSFHTAAVHPQEPSSGSAGSSETPSDA